MSDPSPKRDECPSDLQLDRLRVGELTKASEELVRAHLGACTECKQRYTLVCADAERFAREAPAFETLRTPRAVVPSRRAIGPRRWATWSAVAAAAGLLLLVSRGARQRQDDSPPAVSDSSGPRSDGSSVGVRTKGASASFDFVVRRDEHTVLGTPEMILYPGDRLRFTVSASESVYSGVWGIDAQGQVSDYATAPELLRIVAGEQIALPQTIELDASVGNEHIVAVFCQGPQADDAIRSALADNPERPQLPFGCHTESVQIRKAPR